MKKLLLILALTLLPSLAFAQCNGIFPNNTICGNATGAPNTARPTSTSVLTGVPGGSNGQIQYNNAGAFGGFTMAGDCTTTVPNITCTKVNGVTYGAGPATDTVPLVTAANTTTYTAIANCPNGYTLNYSTSTHQFSCNNACPVGWFCVSTHGSITAAVNALNTAGSGTLYVDQAATVGSALTITASSTILCKDFNAKIATSSSTDDLFTITANAITIRDCALAYTGGATKTAGYLINSTGTYGTFDNLNIDGNCWRCINSAGIIKIVSNTVMNANSIAVAGNSGGIVNTAEVLHLSNITIGAGPTFAYDFGILITQGAVDAVNLELIQEAVPLKIMPGAGVGAFLKMATSYLDNCTFQCMLVQTNTGSVGYIEINSTEFGTANTTASNVQIDTGTLGGNIGSIVISNSNIFGYSANSANGILLVGSLGSINLNNSQIGENHAVGFATSGAATTTGLDINHNHFHATTNSIAFGAAQTNAIIQGNRLGGKAMSLAGSGTTYIVNNVP